MPRPVTVVDAGARKELDVEVVVPVADMASLGETVEPPASAGAAAGPLRRSIWPAIHPRLLDLVQSHRSTLIFANARRLAERLAARLNELHLEAEDRAPNEEAQDLGGSSVDLPRETNPRSVGSDGAQDLGGSSVDLPHNTDPRSVGSDAVRDLGAGSVDLPRETNPRSVAVGGDGPVRVGEAVEAVEGRAPGAAAGGAG